MENDSPLVSILVPMYNHEKYIADCLRSIASQDYPNMELLIADDRSTDESYPLAEKVLASLQNNKFTHIELNKNADNIGVCGNINSLIKNARGSYIKILASDDMLMPHAISQLVCYLESHPDEGAVLSNVAMVAESECYPDVLAGDISPFYKSSPFDPVNPFRRLYEGGDNLLVAGLMVRTSLYERYGLYDETLRIEDWEFWLRIFAAGERVGWCSDVSALYRLTPGSLSHPVATEESKKRLARNLRDELRVLHKYKSVEGVDFKVALTRLINSRLSVCLKTDYLEGVAMLLDIAKRENVRLSAKSRVKIFAHKLGLY